MTDKIDIVGGPAHGQSIEKPYPHSTMSVVGGPSAGGYSKFEYTLRRCRDAQGRIVEVLAPAGRPIDPAYLAAKKLTN